MEAFNARVGLRITKLVGSMWCAYIFTGIALLGLPAALHPGGEGIAAWVAQTFLQLVLLSVIMVGQDVQSKSAEERDVETHDAVMEQLAINRQEQQEILRLLAATAGTVENLGRGMGDNGEGGAAL